MKGFEKFDLTEYDNATLWLGFLSVLALSIGVTGYMTWNASYSDGYAVGFQDGKINGSQEAFAEGQQQVQEEIANTSTIYLRKPGEFLVRQWGIHFENNPDLVCQFSFDREYLTGSNSRKYNGTQCGWTDSNISDEWVYPESDRYLVKTIRDTNSSSGDEN